MAVIEPNVNAKLEDNSTTDESFNQQGNTINVSSGATLNQNCGNSKHEFKRWESTAIICVLVIIGFFSLLTYFNHAVDKFKQESDKTHDIMQIEYRKLIQKSNDAHDDILKKAKDGTIWLLRDDILKTIDFHTQTKIITKKQYKCIKNEYEYYISIGGNHDVKEKYDDFIAKILGTGEIKMVNSHTNEFKNIR